MYKQICALIALIMLVVFLAPVSAAAAPTDPNVITTVIIVDPADGKSGKKDNVAHLDCHCTGTDKGPPAVSCVAYSQENKVYITSGTTNSDCTDDQSVGPPKDYDLKPVCDVPLGGVIGRPDH